jgi:Raf kinase inhibitor-like YbhB/YbcL family protein
MADISVTSPAFQEGKDIPAKYTCDGPNISPPLDWETAASNEIRSFALVCDDPDAPRTAWVHWVVCDLPADTRSLRENIPTSQTLSGGAKQGMSDFGSIGYGGPCPPNGAHRYLFKVFALDKALNLKPGFTKAELVKEMEGHVVAQGQLMGKYARRR